YIRVRIVFILHGLAAQSQWIVTDNPENRAGGGCGRGRTLVCRNSFCSRQEIKNLLSIELATLGFESLLQAPRRIKATGVVGNRNVHHFQIGQRGLVLQPDLLSGAAKFLQSFLKTSIKIGVTPLEEIARVAFRLARLKKLQVILKDAESMAEL